MDQSIFSNQNGGARNSIHLIRLGQARDLERD